MKKYIPLNEEKEKLMNAEIDKMLGKKTASKEIILNDLPEIIETDNNTQVNVIVNKYTKKIANSLSQSDIIQNALEYNNNLIRQLENNKDNISDIEYNNSICILWENLKKLSNNADNYRSKFNLSDNTKYVELYSWYKDRYTPTGLTIVIDKSILIKEEDHIQNDIIEDKEESIKNGEIINENIHNNENFIMEEIQIEEAINEDVIPSNEKLIF
jgi:hypothetical protein